MLLLFHSAAVALNVFALWYDQQYIDIPFPSEDFANMPFKARLAFLTFWNLVLQTVYFTIAILNDIVGTNATAPKKPPFIRTIKDTVFSLAFTATIYVATTFWALYIINKDFILPDHIAAVVPSWLNHTMHTLIVPFILLELLLTRRIYPSRTLGISVALTFNITYISVIFIIYLQTGIWVYPFLNVFSWYKRLLFFASSSVITVLVFMIGEKLDSLSKLNIRVTYTNGTVKSTD